MLTAWASIVRTATCTAAAAGTVFLFALYSDYQYVDLDLPSGLKWAKWNVGASSEEDYGLYFAWGETVGYTKEQVKLGIHPFDESTYNAGLAASIDTDLSGDNDAATVNMGSSWRMPTTTDFGELIDNTTQEDAEINGIQGIKFISQHDEGKYIFFPFAGQVLSTSISNEGYLCRCWSSNINDSEGAYALDCAGGGDVGNAYDSIRCVGFSVRGVISA